MDFNKIFHKVPVQIQNRSAFNCGHKNLFTADVGTLVPCLVDPVIPNTTVHLGMACQVQLPPLSTDFYGNIYGTLEAFFVPNRIIWAGWKYFATLPSVQDRTSQQNNVKPLTPTTLPMTYLDLSNPDEETVELFTKAGGLADMLGYKAVPILTDDNPDDAFYIKNLLPFLAYHKIYDDWYRDSRIQKPIFYPDPEKIGYMDWTTAPYQQGLYTSNEGPSVYQTSSRDGLNIFALHQRNWQKDYFTNATPLPQSGDSASVKFNIQNGQGEFTISALRAANSLQQWFERNNIAGERYSDQIKARFGIYPSDTITDRAIYLGSKTFNIYSKSVYETIAMPGVSDTTKNPFNGQMASKATSVQGFGEDTLISEFTATEHGHIVVIFSLVPEPLYSTGTRRYLNYSEITDFPDPLLQGVGDQPIYSYEVDTSAGPNYTTFDESSSIFGYTQRYSEAKYMNDEVHGLLRDGENLAAFALQRSVDGSTPSKIGSDFITIPKDYLDQVSNVTSNVSDYGCWVECYFKYNKVQPLAAYSIPTLGDPKDTHTEIIDNGGKTL